MKLRKGDRVVVLTGKDRGKEGDIMRAFPSRQMVIVDGVNRVRKHQRATRATMQGGIIDKDMPMPVSSVAIVCGACGEATRVGYRFDDQGAKVRICRKCGADI
ncbi:MAG: 50S ribosomal protein L24 [Actinobacteria bacterium]|nr:MAG: 50S ribosomal protein L24 [Actinomycetota bacterium]